MDKEKEYIRSQSMAAGPVTIADLVCRDCIRRREDLPTAFCDAFKRGERRKPNAVLLGGNCPEYRKG